jgi:5-methylcytosine-specific restriction endonuclease McrA
MVYPNMTLSNASQSCTKPKRWSRQHDCCLNCQRTDRKHMGKGLCLICYYNQYSVENADRVKAIKQASYHKRGGKELSKRMREKAWFDGNREAALQRDNYKCTCCGTPEDLVVHHIDGNGRRSENPNNDLDNLQTLCRSCHAKVHKPRTTNKWSIHYDCCQSCGCTDVKHSARGLCKVCYSRARHQQKTGS